MKPNSTTADLRSPWWMVRDNPTMTCLYSRFIVINESFQLPPAVEWSNTFFNAKLKLVKNEWILRDGWRGSWCHDAPSSWLRSSKTLPPVQGLSCVILIEQKCSAQSVLLAKVITRHHAQSFFCVLRQKILLRSRLSKRRWDDEARFWSKLCVPAEVVIYLCCVLFLCSEYDSRHWKGIQWYIVYSSIVIIISSLLYEYGSTLECSCLSDEGYFTVSTCITGIVRVIITSHTTVHFYSSTSRELILKY
jgi:hypothetical protein